MKRKQINTTIGQKEKTKHNTVQKNIRDQSWQKGSRKLLTLAWIQNRNRTFFARVVGKH